MRLKHIATLIISGYVLISCSSYNRILEGIYDKDQYSTEADIPKGKDNMQQVKVFDGEHISGFFKYPVEYTETIVSFMNNN